MISDRSYNASFGFDKKDDDGDEDESSTVSDEEIESSSSSIDSSPIDEVYADDVSSLGSFFFAY